MCSYVVNILFGAILYDISFKSLTFQSAIASIEYPDLKSADGFKEAIFRRM